MKFNYILSYSSDLADYCRFKREQFVNLYPVLIQESVLILY